MADDNNGPLARLRNAADKNDGTSKLADAAQKYLTAKATSMVNGATEKLGSYAERLVSDGPSGALGGLLKGGKKLAEGGNPASAVAAAGGQAIKDKTKDLAGALGGRAGRRGSGPKSVNIVENIDVGVPVRVAYNQWSRFPDFGDFTKGVQTVEEEDEVESKWTAKILWSTRSWKATVTEQIQDYRIAWTSEADKGTTKGVVTFHPLGDNLTRVLLVVEYFPKGFFEQTANLWRAQGRRLRLDLKHYRRQVMMMAQEESEELEAGTARSAIARSSSATTTPWSWRRPGSPPSSGPSSTSSTRTSSPPSPSWTRRSAPNSPNWRRAARKRTSTPRKKRLRRNPRRKKNPRTSTPRWKRLRRKRRSVAPRHADEPVRPWSARLARPRRQSEQAEPRDRRPERPSRRAASRTGVIGRRPTP
ncbi:SRPBCC family protein [Allosalinactinospora lopnorensis]|uniref:SRPBCC family protein n=1 Tax=Allosalinactinospora lopnorensis TaxID=1352348 RepID=UPI001F15FC19|nr:SRPBCC family protein [Allosalinactinospora lopnorensis]